MWRQCWISCAGRRRPSFLLLFFHLLLIRFCLTYMKFDVVLQSTGYFSSLTYLLLQTFNRQTKGSVACAAYEKMWHTHHHTEAESVNINFHLFIRALFVFFLSAAAITYWFMKVMSLSKHRSRQTWGKIHAQIASLMINRLTCAIHLHVCICMCVYAFPHLRSSDVPWDLIYKTCVCCKKIQIQLAISTR